ncbi:MAG: glycosyltransferase family 2 protein [Pseudomonadota bacterium]
MPLPLTVLMITLNEAHNMRAVLDDIDGWAEQAFVVDSFSSDDTVDIALSRGAHVVQRKFTGFGDQWNYALSLPIKTPWTIKLDPDERLTDALKSSIARTIETGDRTGYEINRRLWFMGKPMPVVRADMRLWKTGSAKFTDVLVNEHPVIDGSTGRLDGELQHHDSPNLHHWFQKQNAYGTSEAVSRFRDAPLAAEPKLGGTSLERRMWLKKQFWRIPGRYHLIFWYHLLVQGAWKAGRVGWIWSHLRTEHRRNQEFKLTEMKLAGTEYALPASGNGPPHPQAVQAED